MLRLLLVLEVFMQLFVFVVPKLHILGHTTSCQLLYSFNYTLGGGQTDGEGIERPWSMIGGVAASTRVSGPGARSDLLDDHWSFWNWSKLVNLGLTEAQVREKLEAEEELQALTGKLRIHEISPVNFIADLLEIENEQRRIAGLAELKKAKSTTMKINLRRLRRSLNKRIAKIRLLQATYMPAALQQLKEMKLSENILPEDIPLIPPSALTALRRREGGCLEGLAEIEKFMRDAQCRAALVGLRNQLLVKYRLLLYKTNHSRNQTMNTRSRSLVARNESQVLLHSKKYQAAWLALVLLEDGVEGRVGWRRLCKEDIRCLEDSEELVKKHARGEKAEARRARDEAALRQAGITPLNIHRVQNDSDADEEDNINIVSAPPRNQASKKKKMPAHKGSAVQSGESRRVVSWIWTMAGMTGSDAEMEEALRIEWAKAYARVRRWNEEVALLQEEWRRLPQSFAHEEGLWTARAKMIPVGAIPPADAEGLMAYALKHVSMYRNLAGMAEAVRTQPKLKKGTRRPRYQPAPAIDLTAITTDGNDGAVDVDGYIEEDDADGEDGNQSDEELLLTGEIDDW
ncbi:hypothetical protein MIND_00972100 [Mycena indigotica]|uniref:Uncharacterized protein n=1 Tax=Mycena indigotica TaxID=2126181 RepID=A0A8H6SES3_9AGAR|nr:uncharacterized protein MIND_00972100 [Mycena indigotica]KAF7297386.1 hypothetical protein MIND_00972100 [Mycena indigotica]